MMYFSLDTLNNKTKPKYEQVRDAVERLERRTFFHAQLYKLLYVVFFRGLRLIIENPATTPHYLVGTQNFLKPTIIDKNRMERGDEFKKPTAYWFINCKPTDGYTPQNDKEQKIIDRCERSKGDGLCSEERSMIHPDYARNFICDFILGKVQKGSSLQLDFGEAQ